MKKTLTTPLSIDEIEFRVQSTNQNGAIVLPYKDARADMNRLDEVVGAHRWQRKHEIIGGHNYCTVSIKTNDGWISKMDVGTESNTEAIKGASSDAFKRACFNWGIGRELYDYPFIFIKFTPEEKANPRSFQFELKKFKWYSQFEDGKLIYLGAKHNGTMRFEYGKIKKELINQ